MRCPICGAKLVGKQLCPYCKITDEQILNASNRKVKEYRKTGNKDMIHFSNIVPNDVSKLKIILYTIFFGILGVNHYYVLRNIRGTYSLVSTVGFLFIFFLGIAVEISVSMEGVYNVLYNIFFYMMAINVFMWLGDIFACIFRSFKIPFVLAQKENK